MVGHIWGPKVGCKINAVLMFKLRFFWLLTGAHLIQPGWFQKKDTWDIENVWKTHPKDLMFCTQVDLNLDSQIFQLFLHVWWSQKKSVFLFIVSNVTCAYNMCSKWVGSTTVPRQKLSIPTVLLRLQPLVLLTSLRFFNDFKKTPIYTWNIP